MKTIVISAVNITEAGPLTILNDCLAALSEWISHQKEAYRVVAIVYRKELVCYPRVDYIETQWPKKKWINRLWYEYVSMWRISKKIGKVDLWFSLHDTTPNVRAERRVVYCHNALSFYKWTIKDFFFAPKMALLTAFTKYIYRPNIHRNEYIIVQQAWFGTAMRTLFGLDKHKIIVAPPTRRNIELAGTKVDLASKRVRSFLYAASPNVHKNFEIIGRAAEILENRYQLSDFEINITLRGDENRYAKWLYKKWGGLPSLRFIGFLPKNVLYDYYERCEALIYASKAESWGLPISEFARYDKYMLLADLPYARETAGGSARTAFFNPDKPEELAALMKELIEGDLAAFQPVPQTVTTDMKAENWPTLFSYLLTNSWCTKREPRTTNTGTQ